MTRSKAIAYRPQLVTVLEGHLREAFNRQLTLTKPGGDRRRTGETRISVANPDREIVDDGGRVHRTKAIRGRENRESGFHVGFSGVFDYHIETVCLQHVSLSVFYEIVDGEPVPFFRAEWDALAATDDASAHAQPHWHFVQSPSRIESIVKRLASGTMEFRAADDEDLFRGTLDLGRCHFAMASLRPGSGRRYKEVFSSDDFAAWFRELVTYIAGQIDYVRSRSKPETVAEFAPSSRGGSVRQ